MVRYWYVTGTLPNNSQIKMEKEKVIRKLTKTGRNSRYVILPKDFLEELGWRERQKLTVERVRGGILIKDWRKR